MVQEAAFIAEELNKKTDYSVTLQIPAANLNANRKVRGVCVSERGKESFEWQNLFVQFTKIVEIVVKRQ